MRTPLDDEQRGEGGEAGGGERDVGPGGEEEERRARGRGGEGGEEAGIVYQRGLVRRLCPSCVSFDATAGPGREWRSTQWSGEALPLVVRIQ